MRRIPGKLGYTADGKHGNSWKSRLHSRWKHMENTATQPWCEEIMGLLWVPVCAEVMDRWIPAAHPRRQQRSIWVHAHHARTIHGTIEIGYTAEMRSIHGAIGCTMAMSNIDSQQWRKENKTAPRRKGRSTLPRKETLYEAEMKECAKYTKELWRSFVKEMKWWRIHEWRFFLHFKQEVCADFVFKNVEGFVEEMNSPRFIELIMLQNRYVTFWSLRTTSYVLGKKGCCEISSIRIFEN